MTARRVRLSLAVLGLCVFVGGCSSTDLKQFFHTFGQVSYDSLKEADRRESLEPHER